MEIHEIEKLIEENENLKKENSKFKDLVFNLEFIKFNVEIKKRYNLTYLETLLYGIFDFFKNQNWIKLTNKQLADMLDSSEQSINNSIKNLEEKKVIKRITKNEGYDKIRSIYLYSYFENKANFQTQEEEIEEPEQEELKQEPKEKKQVKRVYGEFKNVKLTDEEVEKLKEKFGEEKYEYYLKKLDEGKEMKGYKYKSDYLAFLNWTKNGFNNKEEVEKEILQEKTRKQEEEIEKRRKEQEEQEKQEQENKKEEFIKNLQEKNGWSREQVLDYVEKIKEDNKIFEFWRKYWVAEKTRNLPTREKFTKVGEFTNLADLPENKKEIIETYREDYYFYKKNWYTRQQAEFREQQEKEREAKKEEKPKKTIEEMKRDFLKKSEDYFNN